MGEINLKPCPFCGGKAEFFNYKHRHLYIRCLRCYAEPYVEFIVSTGKSEEDALKNLAEKWNRRAYEAD